MGAAFERVIALSLDRASPEAAKAKHIAIARKGLAAWMARQTVKPDVEIVVDGAPSASEANVRPFGIITYRFVKLRPACAYAIEQARALSPVKSGRYRKSWFFLVNDKETALEDIPNDATVILTNDQPYSRKINVGAKGYQAYAPPGIVEKVRVLVRQRFGKFVDARPDFITLQGGHRLAVPIKRGRNIQRELTYPSLVIKPKGYT